MRLPPCPLTTQAQHFCHRRPAVLQCSKRVALKPPTATALQRGVELQYSNAASIKNDCLKCNTPFTSVFGPGKWLPLKHSNIAADTRPPVWQPEVQQWKQSNGQPATARTRVYLCCKAAAKAAEKALVVQLCRAVVLRTCCTAGLLGCRASSVRMLRLCSQKTGR